MALNFLRSFHDIVSNQGYDFDQKIDALLQFGLRVFELDIAIVSRIDDQLYTVLHVITPDNSLQVDTQFDVNGTYCFHTLNAKSALAFNNTAQSEIATHPCYLNFGLESYIGAPITVNGRPFGTVNFSSSCVSPPFTQTHIDYIELLAQWLGAEFAQKATVEQLEKNDQTLKKLESVAKIGTWEVDLNSGKIDWSEQTRRIHEVDDNFIPNLATGISFYKEGHSQTTITEAIENTISTGETWDLELELVTAQGNEIWVSTQGKAEFHKGECIRLFGTFQDITEQVILRQELEKQKREAEISLRDRSAMFAKVSHELRTPLNGILGMLNALIDESDDNKRQEKLELALKSSKILLKIVNEVLDYSKITHGQMNLEPERFQLETVFTDLVSIYKPQFAEKAVTFVSRLDIPTSSWVHFDRMRLGQILSNLLSNAFKFTHTGSVELIASAEKQLDDIKLTIRLSDTGVGMSEAFMQSVFTPFTQDKATISLHQEGTGLGLSIVKELVDLMAGSIRVESQLNKGTVFEISISLPAAQDSPLGPAPDLITLLNGSDLNVLVVDDNDINRIVLASCLEKFLVTSHFAVSGEDAIEKCKQTPFDLIFMDCVMPGLDGLSATKILREEGIVSTQTLIAAVTANTTDADKLACEQAGMNMFIAKPFEQESIQAAILEAKHRLC